MYSGSCTSTYILISKGSTVFFFLQALSFILFFFFYTFITTHFPWFQGRYVVLTGLMEATKYFLFAKSWLGVSYMFGITSATTISIGNFYYLLLFRLEWCFSRLVVGELLPLYLLKQPPATEKKKKKPAHPNPTLFCSFFKQDIRKKFVFTSNSVNECEIILSFTFSFLSYFYF